MDAIEGATTGSHHRRREEAPQGRAAHAVQHHRAAGRRRLRGAHPGAHDAHRRVALHGRPHQLPARRQHRLPASRSTSRASSRRCSEVPCTASTSAASSRRPAAPDARREGDHRPPADHPTAAADPEKLKPEEWKLYNLVSRRFMATLSDPAVIEGTKVTSTSPASRSWRRATCSSCRASAGSTRTA